MNRTEIANYALGVIGSQRINSLDDSSTIAAKCKNLLPVSEGHVLRIHAWPSHTVRMVLPMIGVEHPAQENAPKSFGYVLPHNLRVLGVEPATPYVIENGVIFTDSATCTIRFVSPPTAEYTDPHLAEAIALHLATRLAVDMADDLQKQATIKQEYFQVLDQARQIASDESTDADDSRAWWYQ